MPKKKTSPKPKTSKSSKKLTPPTAEPSPPSFLRSLARMSLQAQAICPEHMSVPVEDDVASPASDAATSKSTSPPPAKWWTELVKCDAVVCPVVPSSTPCDAQRHHDTTYFPFDSPDSISDDKTMHRSAARRAIFSKATYPTVLDSIIGHAANADRLALRLVCRRLAAQTDAILFDTLTVRVDGFHGASGEILPLINMWRRPDVASAIRVLTIADEWEYWGVLADVFPGVSPDVLRVPASCSLDIIGVQGRTLVVFADIVPSTTPDWLRVHSLPLPLSVDVSAAPDGPGNPHRLVYTVRHADPDLLLVSLPEPWDLPASVDQLVVYISPCPAADPAPHPDIFDRSHADDGAHVFLKDQRRSSDYGLSRSPGATVRGVEWLHAAKGHPCFLDRLASVVAANVRPGRRFTFVATENWDERWLCSSPGQSTIVYRFFYAVVRHARRIHRWNGRFAERAIGASLQFVDEDEYRLEVGQERWRLETEMET